MAAATFNLIKSGSSDYSIEQGATYRATVIWKTGTPAVPVNITGYTARMMMKASPIREASKIVGVSKANPGVVTTDGEHKLVSGQSVVLPGVGGMVELSSRYTVTVISPKTFSIGVDTTTFTTYTSGGTVAFVNLTSTLGSDGQLIIGTTGGDIQIYILDSITNLLSGGGSYDLEMIATGATPDVTRLVQGVFVVSPNTTG